MSERNEILHNIDDIWGSASLTVDEWKVHKGTNYKGVWDEWYGPAGTRTPASYNANGVVQSLAGKAISQLKLMPSIPTIRKLRDEANVNCLSNKTQPISICRPLEKPCLFNTNEDPCEQNNLSDQ